MTFNTIHHNTITDNKIDDDGVKALCDGLMVNKSLTDLKLCRETIITETRRSEKRD